ncbi:type VII secretion target [Nocardia sp. NPDC058658]|uniref:type VII secretion target n=1 Tax=Nocardia sp. NPDC058658 TaxID=3346580 RepID=UPI00364B8932
MSNLNIKPAEMRDLARHLRSHASTMSARQPIANLSRDMAREKMQDSNLAVKVEESLKALDSVIKFHVRRLNEHGDLLEKAAAAYEQGDQAWADGFK